MAGNYGFSLHAKVADVISAPLGGTNSAKAEIKYQRDGTITVNPYAGVHALTAGAVTLTLSALTAIGGGTLNLTGAVIRGMIVENLGANVMTFSMGLTNGFPIPTLGVAGLGVGATFSPAAGGFGTVATADNTIDVAGTTTQSFKIILITDAAP